LGDGTRSQRLAPVPVAGLTDAVELTAGGAQTCARRRSGAVACWGNNFSGALGDGTTTTGQPAPVPIPGLTDAVELAAGGVHTCARRSTGAVICWGSNAYGQAGDGTVTTRRPAPVPVADLTDVVELAAGGAHTCARRSTGAVACWGDNRH